MNMIDLTDLNFETEVTKATSPVIVVWTTVSNVASTLLILQMKKLELVDSTTLKFGKVDIDLYPALAIRFSIRELPLVMRFEDGLLVAQASSLTKEILGDLTC
jgi:thioredoxin-like negative regulator of GroEL